MRSPVLGLDCDPVDTFHHSGGGNSGLRLVLLVPRFMVCTENIMISYDAECAMSVLLDASR